MGKVGLSIFRKNYPQFAKSTPNCPAGPFFFAFSPISRNPIAGFVISKLLLKPFLKPFRKETAVFSRAFLRFLCPNNTGQKYPQTHTKPVRHPQEDRDSRWSFFPHWPP